MDEKVIINITEEEMKIVKKTLQAVYQEGYKDGVESVQVFRNTGNELFNFIGAMNMHDEISNEAYEKISAWWEGEG